MINVTKTTTGVSRIITNITSVAGKP